VARPRRSTGEIPQSLLAAKASKSAPRPGGCGRPSFHVLLFWYLGYLNDEHKPHGPLRDREQNGGNRTGGAGGWGGRLLGADSVESGSFTSYGPPALGSPTLLSGYRENASDRRETDLIMFSFSPPPLPPALPLFPLFPLFPSQFSVPWKVCSPSLQLFFSFF